MKKRIINFFKKYLLNKVILITVLSSLTFIVPVLFDAFVIRKLEVSNDQRSFITIGISLLIIFLNLLIAKKWLSFSIVGLQKKGFGRSLLYSLGFIILLRLLDYFGWKEIFPKEFWTKSYLLYVSTFIFLAFQEELMFRGIIFKIWEKWKGFLVALFFSSILFGLEHLLYPALGFEQVTMSRAVTTALWGPVFVLIAYRTNNIWGLSISHFLYNASLATSETITQQYTVKDSFWFISIGLFFFLPILIDKIDQLITKIKKVKIVWSNYLAVLLILFFSLSAGIILYEDLGLGEDKPFCPTLENDSVKECIEESYPVDENCHGINLRLEEAKNEVRGNEKALEILEKNCLWLLDAQFYDLTNDKQEELIMTTAGAGCASCHWNRFYILKEDLVIFEKEAEDIFFWPAEDYDGFIISYPLRKVNEAYCCPTEGIMESYQVWYDEYRYFYKFDERSFLYEEE